MLKNTLKAYSGFYLTRRQYLTGMLVIIIVRRAKDITFQTVYKQYLLLKALLTCGAITFAAVPAAVPRSSDVKNTLLSSSPL